MSNKYAEITVKTAAMDALSNTPQDVRELHQRIYRSIPCGITRVRIAMLNLWESGMVQRVKIKDGRAWRFAYFLPSMAPVIPPETGEVVSDSSDRPLSVKLPKGCTHLSNNGRQWYEATRASQKARFARGDGKHYRRVREQDVNHAQSNRWALVTAAHVEHFGKERIYG